MQQKIFPLIFVLVIGVALGFFLGNQEHPRSSTSPLSSSSLTTTGAIRTSTGNGNSGTGLSPSESTGGIKEDYFALATKIDTFAKYQDTLTTITNTASGKDIPYFTGIVLFGHTKPYFLYTFYEKNSAKMDQLVTMLGEDTYQSLGLIPFFTMCRQYHTSSSLQEFFNTYNGNDSDFLYFKNSFSEWSLGKMDKDSLIRAIDDHLMKRKETEDYPFIKIYDTYIKRVITEGTLDCGTLLLDLGNIWDHGS